MSLNDFRTYQSALEFYWECERLKYPKHLMDQLLRAASSIALNLSEGSAKPTAKDRACFYYRALGSLRECQTVLDLMREHKGSTASQLCHSVGAHLFKLCQAQDNSVKKPKTLSRSPTR
jgi:four helix bundle protein